MSNKDNALLTLIDAVKAREVELSTKYVGVFHTGNEGCEIYQWQGDSGACVMRARDKGHLYIIKNEKIDYKNLIGALCELAQLNAINPLSIKPITLKRLGSMFGAISDLAEIAAHSTTGHILVRGDWNSSIISVGCCMGSRRMRHGEETAYLIKINRLFIDAIMSDVEYAVPLQTATESLLKYRKFHQHMESLVLLSGKAGTKFDVDGEVKSALSFVDGLGNDPVAIMLAVTSGEDKMLEYVSKRMEKANESQLNECLEMGFKITYLEPHLEFFP